LSRVILFLTLRRVPCFFRVQNHKPIEFLVDFQSNHMVPKQKQNNKRKTKEKEQQKTFVSF